MTTNELPDWLDARLAFRSTSRAGLHYFYGNPHTFRGRIASWHEDGYAVNVSRGEVIDATDFALVWIDGFLAGSEPPPPADASLEEEEAWNTVRNKYRATGEFDDSDIASEEDELP